MIFLFFSLISVSGRQVITLLRYDEILFSFIKSYCGDLSTGNDLFGSRISYCLRWSDLEWNVSPGIFPTHSFSTVGLWVFQHFSRLLYSSVIKLKEVYLISCLHRLFIIHQIVYPYRIYTIIGLFILGIQSVLEILCSIDSLIFCINLQSVFETFWFILKWFEWYWFTHAHSRWNIRIGIP